MELVSKIENEFETAYEFLKTFKIKNESKKLFSLLNICEEVWEEEIKQYKMGFNEEDYHLNDFIIEVVEGDPIEYLIPICDYIVRTQEELLGCVYEVGALYDGGIYVKFFSIRFNNIEDLNNFYALKKKEIE